MSYHTEPRVQFKFKTYDVLLCSTLFSRPQSGPLEYDDLASVTSPNSAPFILLLAILTLLLFLNHDKQGFPFCFSPCLEHKSPIWHILLMLSNFILSVRPVYPVYNRRKASSVRSRQENEISSRYFKQREVGEGSC